MRRFVVSATPDKLVIGSAREGQAADAAANIAIALLLCIAVAPLMAVSRTLALSLLFLLPPLWFFSLGLINLLRMVLPARTIIDLKTGDLLVRGRMIGRTGDVQALRIAFTGATGPSRYSLLADLPGGSIPLASTGYFGSREELQQLSQMIADFTRRIDLYAR